MTWTLVEASDTECLMDDSGVYVTIHRIETTETHKEYSGQRVTVRCDLMASGDEPVKSWIGSANAVRKAVIRFLADVWWGDPISAEHASYIGYELMRAETTENYVQD